MVKERNVKGKIISMAFDKNNKEKITKVLIGRAERALILAVVAFAMLMGPVVMSSFSVQIADPSWAFYMIGLFIAPVLMIISFVLIRDVTDKIRDKEKDDKKYRFCMRILGVTKAILVLTIVINVLLFLRPLLRAYF